MKGDYQMSTSINVQVNGQTVTIQSGEKLEDVKKKLANPADTIFEGVDANSNGKLEAGELQKLKTNLENNNYTVEVAEDGKTPRRAYNDAMQNLRNSYNAETLGGYFKGDDADLHVVKKGETLYTIAKKQLVKENNNDSAKAFNGTATATGDDWTKGTSKKGQADGVVNDKVADYKKQPTLVDGKTSTIAVTKNGLNMGKGVPVDKDGNVLKDFKDLKYKQGGCIMKYSNPNHDPQEMYQITYGAGKADTAYMFKGVKLSAPTIKELKDLAEKFKAEASKIKTAPANETAEAKAKRNAENVAALKALVTLTGGNEQVIKNVAEKLLDDSLIDRRTDDYKAFVQDLLLTRNADVVSALIPKNDGKFNMGAVKYDRTSHEHLAGMYQEIRRDEINGKKLTDEQLKLKDVLVPLKDQMGYTIEANEEKETLEKKMQFDSMDGTTRFASKNDDGKWYYATDEKTLDKFMADLKAANDDTKKAELFKKYATKGDTELAKCLLERAKDLKASDEDIKTVINANGMEVLAKLDRSDDADWSDDIKNAMNARIKDIYTKEKGNLENAAWLGVANEWIYKLPEDQQAAAITEIAETYFEKTTTKDEEGNDKTEYTFNPTRRPTKEEMEGLHSVPYDDMRNALIKYTKLEDMGKGQYNHALEDSSGGKTVPHYADMVENMSDKNEVLDFIDNKIASYKNWNVPYDKILEKFPDDKDVKDKLLSYVDGNSTISDENRLALVKTYMKEENGKVSLDKTKLPKGANAKYVLDALPQDCKAGDAAKYFTAALKELGIADLVILQNAANRNEKAVKARLAELVKSNMGDKAFVQEVCKLNGSITPYQALYEVDANKAKWDDKTKQAVFEKIFNGRNASKYLEGSVKNHLAENHPYATTERLRKRYIIGDAVYIVNADKSGKITLKKMSKAGIADGVKMHQQVVGPGSGKIGEMLASKDGDYKDYITKDNVASLIVGFNDNSPNEGMMQYIANESKTFSQQLCNKVANKLINKAKAVGLGNTKECTDLSKFINQHNDSTNGYSEAEGKDLDALLNALANKVLEKF